MGSKSEDEKSEVIERWLERVSEGSAAVKNRTPSSTTNNNHHPKHSNQMGGNKRPKPQREASPSAKRRATTSDRKTRSMTIESVHLPDQETRSDDSRASTRSRSVTVSTRVQRGNLSLAHPKIYLYSLHSSNKPAAVTELFSNFVDTLEDSIPNALRENVKALENGTPVALDTSMMSNGDARLRGLAQEATSQTSMEFAASGDEGDWTDIVSYLIKSVMSDSRKEHVFAVNKVQNAGIGPSSLIPTRHGKPIAFKKVDLAIVFSEKDLERAKLNSAVREHFEELCQSEDGKLRRVCQFAAIDMKSPDGSYYGASVQLGIWLAAGLEKTRELKAAAAARRVAAASQTASPIEETPLLPYVGIAVVGHVWNLHLGSKAADGTVYIYGPLVLGDTATIRGTFRVFAALNHLRDWGENTYYPWLLKEVLLPLTDEAETELAGLSTAGPASSGGAVVKGKGRA